MWEKIKTKLNIDTSSEGFQVTMSGCAFLLCLSILALTLKNPSKPPSPYEDVYDIADAWCKSKGTEVVEIDYYETIASMFKCAGDEWTRYDINFVKEKMKREL